jgi:methylase of polypeptide subunit release factors
MEQTRDISDWYATDQRIWNVGRLNVAYVPTLDGTGRTFAPLFVAYVQTAFKGRTFNKVFEWCCGPAFIGFALLDAGLCKNLYLADINPAAIECVKRTVDSNGLSDRVAYCVSDNFDAIPKDEVFDLVVGNPPNYFRINPEFPNYDKLARDLRPNDPGWHIHRKFYSQVGRHLTDGATLIINEIDPLRATVFLPGVKDIPYDLRDRPAVDDFKDMIREGGLHYVGTTIYNGLGGLDMGFVLSRKTSTTA